MSDADAASAATAELSEVPLERFEDQNSDKSSNAGQRARIVSQVSSITNGWSHD